MCAQILVTLLATVIMIVIVSLLLSQGHLLLGIVVLACYTLLMIALWGS